MSYVEYHMGPLRNLREPGIPEPDYRDIDAEIGERARELAELDMVDDQKVAEALFDEGTLMPTELAHLVALCARIKSHTLLGKTHEMIGILFCEWVEETLAASHEADLRAPE